MVTQGRVAVVGAGLAGLVCARSLQAKGMAVTVFDKGRSVGGRLSTRRIPPHTFDLGAQYFTARDELFAAQIGSWRRAEVCAPWPGRIVAFDASGGTARPVEPLERLVGTPNMNALAHDLAAGLTIQQGHRVENIRRVGAELALSGSVAPAGVSLGPANGESDMTELGAFDQVVVCTPSSQAVPLVEQLSARLAEQAHAVPLVPCFALCFSASERDEVALRALDFDGAFIGRESDPRPLSWIARDSSKPGRPPGERWVLHASATWSQAWFDKPAAVVTDAMLSAFAELFDLAPLGPRAAYLRRWSLARAPGPLAIGALYDAEARIGVGGDWTCGGRVEGAYLSGLALAERVLA